MDPALFRVRANMALHLRAADRRPIVLEIRQILFMSVVLLWLRRASQKHVFFYGSGPPGAIDLRLYSETARGHEDLFFVAASLGLSGLGRGT